MTRVAWTPQTQARLLGRMLEQVRRTVRTLADEVRPVGPGWVARTHALPMVWTLNQLRISEPVTFADAVALADEHQGGLPYRHIVVEHDVAGHDLEPAFVADGWRAECEVFMALAERPDAPDAQGTVSVLTEAQALALTRRWMAEDRPGISSESLDQLDEYAWREGRLWNERRFGVVDDDGEAVAVTKLRTDPATSWIEDVYTAPEARRRGYARLLVTHASALGAAENPELTFIVADDNDWPKDLYRRIGFERGPSTETTVPWPEPLGAQAGSVMRGPPVG